MRRKITKTMLERIVKSNLVPKLLRPTFAGLIITGRCNNKCRTCTYWKRKFVELNTNQWKKIINELFNNGFRDFGLIGGEVFLRKDFLELARHIKLKGGTVSITTNGVLAENFVKELLLFDTVAFSINSLKPEVHDYIVGCKGAHNKCVEAFRKVRKLHKKVGINFVIQDINYEEILGVVNFAEKEKASFLDLIYVSINAFDKTVCEDQRLRKFNEKKLNYLLKEACKHKIVVESMDYFNLAIARNKSAKCNVCLALQMGVLVNTNGDILPCCGPLPVVGNISKEPWTSIWNRYKKLRIAALNGTAKPCKTCTETAIESHYTIPYIISKVRRVK